MQIFGAVAVAVVGFLAALVAFVPVVAPIVWAAAPSMASVGVVSGLTWYGTRRA